MVYRQTNNPISRKSSPLNKHDEWQSKIDAAKAAYIKKHGDESGFYEAHADIFKKQEEDRRKEEREKGVREGYSKAFSVPHFPLNTFSLSIELSATLNV